MVVQQSFTKYEGNGNDFIIFDLRFNADPFSHIASHAQNFCDRHVGIGADGIIVLLADRRMHVYNADGSEAYNCGNGLRCAANYLCNEEHVASVTLQLGGRSFLCRRSNEHDIDVMMGLATLSRLDDLYLASIKQHAQVGLVNIGNDHVVIKLACVIENYDDLVAEVQTHFSSSTLNLGFLSHDARGNYISRVYERGVGFTLACATGACAAATMITDTSIVGPQNFTLHQPGGSIVITTEQHVCAAGNKTFLVGQRAKAREVFRGIC